VHAVPSRRRNRLALPAFLAALIAASAAALGHAGTASAAELFYAADEQNRLVTFSGATTRAISRVAITGLASGEQILGLDVRPANRQVYAFTTASRIYTLNPATGALTAVGTMSFTPGISGGQFGWDFNPTVDRIRLASDARQNLRLNPDTGAIAAVDGQLAYAAGDSGAAATPRIVGSAYTNNVAGATTTQLFAIDSGRDVLALQNPPNDGTLVTIGALGVDTADRVGFDISSVDGVAYASLEVGGTSSLYTINLGTGATTLVGRIGGGTVIRALAAAGTAPVDSAAPTVSVRVTASVRIRALLASGVGVRVDCNEACTVTARVFSGSTLVASTAPRTTEIAGTSTFRLRFTTRSQRNLRTRRTVALTLRITVRDAAGNTTNVTRALRARR